MVKRFIAAVVLLVSVLPGTTGAWFQTTALPTPPAPQKSLPVVGEGACACQVLWVDQRPGSLAKEMADASALGVKPVRISGPGSIAELGGEGSVFKWVISQQGELLGLRTMGDDVIKHSVATGGKAVCAAGMARFEHGLLLIDHKSGHYKPDESCLKFAKPKFEAAGFKVQVVALVQPPKAVSVPPTPLQPLQRGRSANRASGTGGSPTSAFAVIDAGTTGGRATSATRPPP